jgi:hypothetical protein
VRRDLASAALAARRRCLGAGLSGGPPEGGHYFASFSSMRWPRRMPPRP